MKRIFVLSGWSLIGLCAVAFTTLPALADKRVALVIGNSAYANAPRLINPKNDAEDVSAALQRSGFDVISGTDLNKSAMENATIKFSRAARDADVAIFYYSGHAMQFAGTNYLMPIDAKLTDEADLRLMVRADEIIADLQQAKALRILVLDSCRDNPLAEELKRSIGRTRAAGISRGLAKIDSPQGMIVAYATQAGRTADDGTGRNSPYTTAFLKHIEEADEIGTVFRRISGDVYNSTKQSQLPELSLSLIGEYYLKDKPKVAALAPNSDEIAALQTRLRALEAQLKEKAKTDAVVVPPAVPLQKQAIVVPPTVPSGPAAFDTQRAVLYEEDKSNPQGNQYYGTVTWRTENVVVKGAPPELSVRADVAIPKRGIKMSMLFRRNTDASLPASHTVEFKFDLLSNFGTSIANVPGLMMKVNEQARGVPLAGLAVKVSDNYFLSGLSSVDADKVKNISLLKDREWFDIPIVYGNAQRSILAIEKGPNGERVFKEAFAAWKQ